MFRSFAPQTTNDLWRSVERPHPRGRRWIAVGIHTYLEARRKQRRLRTAERQLENLDDRLLKDIGIGRSEIRHIVRNGRGL
jgi:uncharacterized protein YjiS (DUF1127 family)